MRRKRGIRVTAVIMGVLLLAAGTVPVQAKTVYELEQEKQELEKKKQDAKNRQNSEQQKLDSVTGTIGSIQGDVDAAAEEVEEVDAALVETIASVEIIEEELKEKEEVLQKTTADYEAAKETEQKQYDAMKLRIRFMYEKGDSTYLQLLLESQNFGDMVNKADYVEQLYSYDRKMLEEYQRIKQETEDLKNQLEDEKAELQAQQHELEEEQKSLTIILNEKKKAYDDYEAQLAQAKREAAVYKANIKKQSDEIRQLESAASQKDSEIQAAKRAEEEARRAQEEALRRQSEEGGAAYGSSSYGESGGSADSSSSGSTRQYASPSSFSGSKGQQLANYACQFIGNPYVPGGTSLTDGADCSGFVWRVYKDFGYTVPRTSYSVRSYGSEVSYSEAQPGDVVCYAGHVALYIGNGQIVHASTKRTGIKITNATYKEILTIRRVV